MTGIIAMETTNSKKDAQLKPISQYIFDKERNIHIHPNNITTDYQDGGESYIFEVLKKIHDLSSHSQEFNQYIKDWPSRYHLSQKRINFLETLKDFFPDSSNVLEIGSGCGILTRWFGENFQTVDAFEGNLVRSQITRYRTKDLDNVHVYCGNFIHTTFDKKYDIIALVGSLEYFSLYYPGYNDPKEISVKILSQLQESLSDKGIIIIGIENRLGAKYFSGCKEDHTGNEFEGVIGYPEKTPVTFSRNEIDTILSRSGFENCQYYHVFPDYKLTDTIIPENDEVLQLNPDNWIRTPFEDYYGNRLNFFPDALFLKTVVDSNLLWHFSNSFVILAGKSKKNNLAVKWLIKKLRNPENSNPLFFHDITLIKNSKRGDKNREYLVKRVPLFGGVNNFSDEKFEYHISDNDFIPGKLLLFDVYNALFKNYPDKHLKIILKELHESLMSHYSLGMEDSEGYPLVSGEAIDYCYWNLVVTQKRELFFIDKKWKSKTPLSADLILFRNLFNSYDNISPFLKNKDKKSFIISLIQSIYPQYSINRLKINMAFEEDLQYFVYGYRKPIDFESPVQYSITDCVNQNNDRKNQIFSLSQELKKSDQQREEMSARVRDLEEDVGVSTTRIQHLEQDAGVRNQQIEEMTARVRDLEQDIGVRNQQLHEMMIQKQILESENSQIKRSATWKIVSFFHINIVEKIFPPNTARREKYDLGVKGINVLINEGYYTFCTHVFQYFSGIKYHKKVKKQSAFNALKTSDEELDITNNSDNSLIYTPKISIITPVYNVEEKYLIECIESVVQQTYKNWELCLVDDASEKKFIPEILKKYQNMDSRIKVKFNEKNLGISETTNAAIHLATGEFIAFLDNDDLLTKNALFEIVALLNEHKDADVIYSDQDKITQSGKFCEPFYKPDWSPEYFRGVMYVGHLLTVRKSIAEEAGLMDNTYDCVQDYEFMLRVSETTNNIYHVPKILYTWRKIEGSIASNSDSKGNISEKQVKAVNSHLERLGLQAIASPGPFPHRVLITPLPQSHFPLVSIIIPTKDKPELIERCLKSIYELTSYPNFEVIVIDNNTTDEYAKSIINSFPCRKLVYNETFNFSKINNFGAKYASGDYLVFLNNDTQIQSKNWIELLLYYSEQSDIAAVGPLLVFPNNKVQHAGVVLGFRGSADHIMRDYPIDCDGYAGSLICAREVSAVTAACMMVKKSVFLNVEGFNEHYSNVYQDVDLCLKFISNGYRIIFNPRVIITHFECSTRDKKQYDLIDRNLLLDQWDEIIEKGDKYYNCNFDLTNYGLGNTGYREK